MGAAHHQRLRLGPRSADEGAQQPVAVPQEELARGAKLEGKGRIDDVAAGQAEVEVAPLRSDRLGDMADEGDDIVIGGLLDLGDPLGIDGCPLLHGRERLRRNGGTSRLGTSDGELDPEHLLESGPVGPDRAHLGEGVAADHRPDQCARRRRLAEPGDHIATRRRLRITGRRHDDAKGRDRQHRQLSGGVAR